MKKILLLCLLSISFSQQFDYSKMSDADKIMMYDTMKKDPLNTVLLNHFVPGYGFNMLSNGLEDRNSLLRKGLIINGLKFTFLLASVVFHNIQEEEELWHSSCLTSNIVDAIDDHQYNRSYCSLNSDADIVSHISLGIYLGLSIFESYYILNKTKEYNNKLYKNIFGKEPPNIKVSLYPLQDGAGISLTYSFN